MFWFCLIFLEKNKYMNIRIVRLLLKGLPLRLSALLPKAFPWSPHGGEEVLNIRR